MVKFAKNGSDVTTAAVRLARAVTGRPLVAVCGDQPFFSTDDWFIGTTPMAAGIPGAISDLTVSFPYGDLAVTEDLFQMLDGQIACLILEATTQHDPPEEYLTGLLDLTHRYGSLLIFDEMIAGFRLSASGAQGLFGVTPDLSTFGKALGNGFAVSALAGRRDLMERGGIRHEQRTGISALDDPRGRDARPCRGNRRYADTPGRGRSGAITPAGPAPRGRSCRSCFGGRRR